MNSATDMVVYVIPAAGSAWGDWIGIAAAIAATGSAIAALIALRYSAKQIETHEHHNKRMVTPHLTSWVTKHEPNRTYVLAIANHGIGPAVVRCIQVYVDDHLLPGRGPEQLDSAIQLLWSNCRKVTHYTTFSPGDFIPAGTSIELIRFEELSVPPLQVANEAARRLKIIIEYECVLGTLYTFDSSLDLFPTPDYPTS